MNAVKIFIVALFAGALGAADQPLECCIARSQFLTDQLCLWKTCANNNAYMEVDTVPADHYLTKYVALKEACETAKDENKKLWSQNGALMWVHDSRCHWENDEN